MQIDKSLLTIREIGILQRCNEVDLFVRNNYGQLQIYYKETWLATVQNFNHVNCFLSGWINCQRILVKEKEDE